MHMTKKSNLSDLSAQESDRFLHIIQTFKQGLSEEYEAEKSVVASLDHVAAKLAQAQASAHLPDDPLNYLRENVPSSVAMSLAFAKANIKPGPLTIISDKVPGLKALGLKGGVGSNRLTVDQTKSFISLIRAHVSSSTEAGCRILVSAVLLHVVSNISGPEVDVSIVPEFQIEPKKVGYTATSYEGIVNFLLVKGPPASIKFILDGPQLAFTDPDMFKHISSSIYEAGRVGFGDAVSEATMACASYCQQHYLSTSRGCVTNGENWVFFVFNVADLGIGGTVSISKEFRLGEDLSGLPLVLGLLSDWIINSKEKEQQFFTYFNPQAICDGR
ncbi:hypothetical protein BYT27DRAFT_7197515 [Phlegmacium glaucopus]|nr:hypothetical protein BYT27DRAFT_7197515 [Phlegmacium glaucopus]